MSTTTNVLHQHARRAVDAEEKPVTALDLFDLRAADAYLRWPDSPTNPRRVPPPEQAHRMTISATPSARAHSRLLGNGRLDPWSRHPLFVVVGESAGGGAFEHLAVGIEAGAM
jgi:hypothetical protein